MRKSITHGVKLKEVVCLLFFLGGGGFFLCEGVSFLLSDRVSHIGDKNMYFKLKGIDFCYQITMTIKTVSD